MNAPSEISQNLTPATDDPLKFRLRRGRNWFFLGLTYASYYLCRYNLSIIAPELKETLGFNNLQYGMIDAARSWAYALGQFVNGLFTDRLGGKQAMTIGAIGTVILNFLFGFTAWSNISWLLFALILIRLTDGYVQAFGAPGFIKINTAWFKRRERGSFSGIFGIMINLGQTGVGQLAPMLAKGFAVPLIFFTITVPHLDWRYMFIIPPCIVLIVIVLMNLAVKNHPEEAGYYVAHDEDEACADPHEKIQLREVFIRIASNPIVWIVAGAYFCTGFVRAAIYGWYAIYLKETWHVTKIGSGAALFWWFATIMLPVMASAGSLASGVISDKLVRGRRAPVATVLYLFQACFTAFAIMMSEHLIPASAAIAVVLILGIHTSCNATHSILGSAAAMDLGGRKMAGFSSGVIDSFQYIGAGLSGLGLGKLLDTLSLPASPTQISDAMIGYASGGTGRMLEILSMKVINPTFWFASMLPWCVIGMVLMAYLWWRTRGTNVRGG